MNMNYLFLFTISPVQTFISQARKTRDLYAGSQILSELCLVAANQIKDDYAGIIIFPYIENESIPNRFIAKISEQSTDLQKIGENVEKKVRKHFKKIAQQALENSPAKGKKPSGSEEEFYKQFYGQIKNHLNIHWAFYPIDNNDYATAYRELERLQGAIKNVRIFEQFKNEKGELGELGRKCSLDGERNALFFRCKKEGNQPAFIYLNNAIPLADKASLRFSEGLSAVSFVKRFYESEKVKEFASTPHIALMKYVEDLKSKEDGPLLLGKLQVEFHKRKIDYHVFYEENLNEKYFEENLPNDKKLPDYVDFENVQKIVRDIESLNGANKTKYFALIAFDGDNMGKWLSGDYLMDKNQLQEFHQTLSKKLSDFSKYAAECCLVEPHGKTIYAGGDDFLGFVNLHYLLQVMKHLRESYDCKVNQPLKEEFRYKNEHDKLTFSAGVVITHYQMPLNVVLNKARALEKLAKTKGNKDAFAITVMTNSGQTHEAYCQWGINHHQNWNIDRIRILVEHLQENFSDTFIRNLNHELLLLVNENGKIKKDNLVYTEMKRLLGRSLQNGKPKYLVDELCEELKNLYSQNRYFDITNFLEILNIANFIRKETTTTNSHL